MFPEALTQQAARLLELYRRKALHIATAESCTGGLIAALLTEIPGSSDVFERGFVTYHNDAKCAMLGVRAETLREHGAVSQPTAVEMAEGALKYSAAEVAVSVTGIAGPGGATDEKPVGLVHLALARKGEATKSTRCHFTGSRQDVRLAAVEKSLELLRLAAEAS